MEDYDGTTSDLSSQYYRLHQSGQKADKLPFTTSDLPINIAKRIQLQGTTFESLPGLLQRALIWDGGYVMDPNGNLVRIYTDNKRSMSDIAIPQELYTLQTNCTITTCSQNSNATFSMSSKCYGKPLSSSVRCASVEYTSDSRSDSPIWGTGGDPEGVPEFVLLTHETQDNSNATNKFIIHAIHTAEERTTECSPTSYGSIVIPCVPFLSLSETLRSRMGPPRTSALVSTWLVASKAQMDTSSSFNSLLLIPIIGGVALIVCGIWLLWRRNFHKRKDATGMYTPGYNPFNSNESKHPEFPKVQYKSSDPSESDRSTYYNSSSEYGSTPTSSVMHILFHDANLSTKRMVFERIQFHHLVSKGAFGEVWYCHYNQNEVAVKRLLQGRRHTFEEINDFTEEIRLSASLSHPNIIGFLGVAWNSLEHLVMIMEYLHVGDLQSFLARHPETLSWDPEKLWISMGIGRAIGYMHSRIPSLIHRDIKAKNVLLTDDYDAKIIDFGTSRRKQEDGMTAGVGTPYWTAPEVLEGTKYTEQSDIYSFGVLLAELDSCAIPYSDVVGSRGEKLQPIQILELVIRGKLRPTFSSECPVAIRKIATACLQKEPNARPTASELVQMLTETLDEGE